MPAAPALLDQIVQRGDQRLAALEREALLTDVLGVQVALQALGRGELREQRRAAPRALKRCCMRPSWNSSCSHSRSSVSETCANSAPIVAAVDALEAREDLAQRRALGDPVVAAAGIELGVEIRLAQARVVEVEHPRARALQQPERIDVRDQMAAIAVDLHQARDRGLLLAGAAGMRRWARRSAACVRAATAAMTGR